MSSTNLLPVGLHEWGLSDATGCNGPIQLKLTMVIMRYYTTYSVSNLVIPFYIHTGKNLKNIVEVSKAIVQSFLAQYTSNE